MSDDIPKGPQKATRRLPPDPNFEVSQSVGLKRGHDGTPAVIHGLYRRELQEDELAFAEALVNEWSTLYGLDGGVDRAMLYEAVVNFVKARRPEPEGRDGDHNVKDFKGHHARLFREFVESLGINRKNRKGDGDAAEAIAALQAIVKPRGPPSVPTQKNADGVYEPKRGDDE